jgi:hypothetical protein
MQTGQRGAQRPAPGNVTGMTFYKQQREQAAKRKAEETDWYKVGWNAGFDFGYDAGVQAVLKQLQDDGVIDAVEPGDEGE